MPGNQCASGLAAMDIDRFVRGLGRGGAMMQSQTIVSLGILSGAFLQSDAVLPPKWNKSAAFR
jgi:hypothetical protein